MTNKMAEISALQTLKQCRANMVHDFLDIHKHEIYLPSYDHENNPKKLELARKYYFADWLSSHYQVFNRNVAHFSIEEQELAKRFFAGVFLKLLGKYSIIKMTNPSQLNLGFELLDEMKIDLNNLIQKGENTDVGLKKIEVIRAKHRAKFNRMCNELKEKEK